MQRVMTSGAFFVLFALISACSNGQAGFGGAGVATTHPGGDAVGRDQPATPISIPSAPGVRNDVAAASTTTVPSTPAKKVVKLIATPASVAMEVGTERYLTVQGLFEDGQSQDLTGDMRWSVTDEALALEVGPGLQGQIFTALAPGKTEIKARYADLEAVIPLEVVSGVLPDPTVTLSIDEHHDKLSAPKNGVVKIAWASTNAASCSLTAGGAVLDGHTAGKLDYRPTADASVKLVCANPAGVEATDALDVAVTTPKADFALAVAGGGDLESLPAGATVTATWSSSDAAGCKVMVDGTEKGSGAAGEVAIVIDSSTSVRLECRDAADTLVAKQIDVKTTRAVVFPVAAGAADQVPGSTVQRPLAIYFALDVTGSMGGNIQAI
jgi:hypothetical protein